MLSTNPRSGEAQRELRYDANPERENDHNPQWNSHHGKYPLARYPLQFDADKEVDPQSGSDDDSTDDESFGLPSLLPYPTLRNSFQEIA